MYFGVPRPLKRRLVSAPKRKPEKSRFFGQEEGFAGENVKHSGMRQDYAFNTLTFAFTSVEDVPYSDMFLFRILLRWITAITLSSLSSIPAFLPEESIAH
jgi:hypothetical protein